MSGRFILRRTGTVALFALSALIVPARAWAQSSQLVSVATFGNFVTAGVVATITGDADQDAVITVEYRRTGEPAFKAAQTGVHVDATHLVGSVFNLSAGVGYDVRVTLVDPDGVTGTPSQIATVSTRADTFPEPTTRTLYVATNGLDSNPGTQAQPFRTIQHAADVATAGTLVLIQPGIYREEVTVDTSGTASQPIVFRGNGGGAILDGGDAAFAAGGTWTAGTGGVFSRAIGFNTTNVVSELGRLYEYFSLSELTALPTGAPGGFFRDGANLRVKFANLSSPATHTMNVARFENGFHLDRVSFVRIENVEIRHYGSDSFGKGVYLDFANNCAVRSSNIHEVQYAGVWVKGGSGHVIEDNQIWDTSIINWPWSDVKDSGAENNAVYFTDNIGRGNVIRRNVVYGQFNGLAPCGGSGPGAALTNETDVYQNIMSLHNDDAVESEGYCSNVRIFENRIKDVHMAWAVAPAAPGPLYFVRNVAYNFGNTRASQTDGQTASSLKIHIETGAVGPLFMWHNTLLSQAPRTSAMVLFNEGSPAAFIHGRNNVIAGTDFVLRKQHPVFLNWQGDDLYTTSTSNFVRWDAPPPAATYANLAALRAGTGLETPLGISAPPALVNPAGGQYQPTATSPLVNAGAILPNINDDAIGPPDIGAIEIGFIPPTATQYFTLPPCRLVDTRNAVGPRGGPQILPNQLRVFPISGVCGLPATAKAVAVNATVVNPSGTGHIRLFPGNESPPLASLTQFRAGRTRAGVAVVKLATDGAGTLGLLNGSPGSMHFVLDINGYFQ